MLSQRIKLCPLEVLQELRAWVVVKASLNVLALVTAPLKGANVLKMAGSAIQGVTTVEAASMLTKLFLI